MMIAVCDGCGKQENAEEYGNDYHKPRTWFQRSDVDGIQLVCSRPCIEIVAKKSGKTNVVLPI